jgi:FAD/FMN-containing dehydrogenase
MFVGASNAADGITIDLKHLNSVDLSDDESTVSVGPGSRWGKVYQKLEPKGLTVVGGRVTEVGVGGFMLGGELREIDF